MNILDEIKRLQDRIELINNKVVKLENNECKPEDCKPEDNQRKPEDNQCKPLEMIMNSKPEKVHCKPKEKPDASINSMDNKDLLNGGNTKASSRDTGGLPRKKLKKQARRQAVGTSKKDTSKVSAKESSKTD